MRGPRSFATFLTLETAAFLLTTVAAAPAEIVLNGLAVQQVKTHDYYPQDLRLNRITGEVFLAYCVGPSGEPTKISILYPDSSGFSKAALLYMGDVRFRVPKTWEADGGPWRRFRVHIVFGIEDRLGFHIPTAWQTGDPVITITGSVGMLD